MHDFTISTYSPEQTRKLGSYIGHLAEGNDIYLLSGNLGTGKTHLVQGIAFGLGVKEYACSPSFMIAREYHGRLTLYHLDLYRLDHLEEIVDLGMEEYFGADSVCVIEWAEKGSGVLPGDNLTIHLEHISENGRKIAFIPLGQRYHKLVQHLKKLIESDREYTWN